MGATLRNKAMVACGKALVALGAAARASDAADEPAAAFQYRFTAAMLGRHLDAMNDMPVVERPEGVPAEAFVQTGGRA